MDLKIKEDQQPLFLFRSDYSLDSILTWNKKGKSAPGGPHSIIDIAIEKGLKDVVAVEKTFSPFFDALEACQDANLNLIFGYQVCVCQDINEKDEVSKKTESDVIIFIKNGEKGLGYYDLIKLYNTSTVKGFYEKPRLDWRTLKENWSDNLLLALPYYHSYLAKNILYGHNCVPDLSWIKPTVFHESNELPIDLILDHNLDKFPKDWPRVFSKSVRYYSPEYIDAYTTYRIITGKHKGGRATLNAPNLNGFGSDKFCVNF